MSTRTLSQQLQRAWLARGPLAMALWPLSVAYGVLVRLRGLFIRLGWLGAQPLPVPVIVVGNLIAGGAGKTPTVMALVSLLLRQGYRPGIISRGHGGREDGVAEVRPDTPAARCGDEPRLLRIRLAVPVFVGRDRVAAARALLQRHPHVDIIVSDDGLQHRRLPRQAQVLVFDERGAGNGWLLPAGPLREPMPARVPPHSVVLYNAPSPSTPLPGHLAQRALRGLVPLADWWAGAAASEAAWAVLSGRPVLAAAGVAHPSRFFDMLASRGLSVRPLPLPDHHDFATLPWPADTPDVIVTEKDAVKLDPACAGSTNIWVAPLDFRTDAAFDTEVLKLLAPTTTRTFHGHPTA